MILLFKYINYGLKRSNHKALRQIISLVFRTKNKLWLAYDKKLKANEQPIVVHDFGAGSKFLGQLRSVSQIHQVCKSSSIVQGLLQNFVLQMKPKFILELGTSIGIGTRSLAIHPSSKVITVEGCPNTAKIAEKHFKDLNITNIELHTSLFSEFLLNFDHPAYEIVFIDGHHDGDFLQQYVRQILPFCNENCLFICDDIRWSKSMLQAFNSLKSEFRYSNDYFRVGTLSNGQVH